MISRSFFDLITLIIYILVALVSAYILKRASVYSNGTGRMAINRWHILFILMLTIFASFRCVGIRIGGTDTLNYIRDFETSTTLLNSIESNFTSFAEIVFALYTFCIRQITSDYHIYFIISYSLITLSYVMFFNKYGNKYNSIIPYFYLMFFYLKTFSSLRTGLAVAVFLLALVAIDRKKFLSLFLMIMAVFIHRSTIIYAMFIAFYWFFEKNIKKKSGKKIFVTCAALSVGLVLLANVFRGYILRLGFLNSTDMYYISHGSATNVFASWIMFLPQILLLILFLIFRLDESDEKLDFIKVCVVFDIIIIPLALSLGMYRANEYMFLPRLVLWSHYVSLIENKYMAKSRGNLFIYRTIVFSMFMAWFLFRLTHEWYDLGLMYYRFGGLI